MEDDENIINQIMFKNNMVNCNYFYDLCQATIKIELNDGFASGFFLN